MAPRVVTASSSSPPATFWAFLYVPARETFTKKKSHAKNTWISGDMRNGIDSAATAIFGNIIELALDQGDGFP
jgi:hypothetical protein